MNKEVYRFLLSSYGKRPGIWFGLFTELLRTITMRVISVVLLASMAVAVSDGDFGKARSYIIVWALLMLFFNLLASVGDLVALKYENSEYNKTGKNFYNKLVNKDMSFYRDNKTGYLTTIFRQNIDSSLLLVRFFRVELVRVLISLTIPIVILFIADSKVGVITLLLMISQIIYVVWASKKANKYRTESHEIYRKVSGEVADDITNVVAYRSAGSEIGVLGRFGSLLDKEIVTFWKRRSTVVYLNIPRSVITTILVAVAFWVTLSTDSTSPELVGLIVLMITFLFQILRNVDVLPELISTHDDLVTKMYPTLEVLSNKYESIVDPKNPADLRIKSGQIDIKDVTFSYKDDDSNKYIFKNLNLKIAGGEKVGVVGLSGAGKSTLASLIMRFDDTQNGSMYIDGIDIKQVKQSQLHSAIAYVPQEPLLFHRTLKENIAYHHDSATDEDVIKAAKAAHAHEFIKDLPNGYNTIVGERGVKLSGGQKQRVVIARAVLKKAPIILFDEATSALDSESEHIIQRALPEITGSHTSIIIAHRLSTIAGLDRIIVMHDGAIEEEGTHRQLLAKKGRYYSLWNRQTSEENIL